MLRLLLDKNNNNEALFSETIFDSGKLTTYLDELAWLKIATLLSVSNIKEKLWYSGVFDKCLDRMFYDKDYLLSVYDGRARVALFKHSPIAEEILFFR